MNVDDGHDGVYFNKWVGSLCCFPGQQPGLGDLIYKHSHQTWNRISGQKSINLYLEVSFSFIFVQIFMN